MRPWARLRFDDLARRPVAALFALGGVAACLSATVDVTLMALIPHLGRIRELQALRIATLLLERLDVDLLSRLPAWVSRPFPLQGFRETVPFLGLATIATLTVSWSVAAALAPLVSLADKRLRSAGTGASGSWFWGTGYPLAVLVCFSIPTLKAPLYYLAPTRPALALVPPIGCGGWLALAALIRSPRRTARVAGSSVVVGLVFLAFLIAGTAAAVAFGPLLRPARRRPLPSRRWPNVLLVSVDSLRADHLHCYGYPRPTSPAIDSLAREGVLFRTVLSPTSWTLPAHLTLLTALPPESHGVIDDGMQLRPEAVTLAEVLWQAGYATAGVVSGPYLDSDYGFSQGFEHYDDYTVVKVLFKFLHRGSTSPRLVQVAGDWLKDWLAHGRDRPFFLFLHMWDVHYDYQPPPPFDSTFDPDYRGRVTGRDVQTSPEVHAKMDPRDLRHVIALYDGEIAFTDLNIGRLLTMLKSMGVFDDTLVVVTADHGEEFFEHGDKTHHKSLYDESLLVPLVIRFPGGAPTATVTRQVRLMDVGPTILGALGVPPSPGFGGSEDPSRGRDLTPLIRDDAWPPGSAPPAFGHLRNKSELQVSIRTGEFKYIRRERGGSWRDELYDLLADPGELSNLAGQRPPLEGELREALAAWRERWARRNNLSRDMRLNGQQTEELKALGYIQ